MKILSKRVSDSAVEDQSFPVFYSDLNSKKTLFGGRAMEMMDLVCGYVAMRHSNSDCVTRSVDYVDFVASAKLGDVLVFKSSVNRVWRTSMEVGVKAYVMNLKTGGARHILSGYSTFVTVDSDGKPIPVPYTVRPFTKDEKRRYKEAEVRRKIRLRRKRH